ncbi:MAG: (2Fe-2S) ferredoxin domain-containing protein [Candidatus Omnitrophica bacterium]|nr:(2Fe-2S) ferredoxin domain-containing protein [Candidatus Omnitrophota bacterium]
MEKLTPEKLERLSRTSKHKAKNWIRVGMSTCGIAAGAGEVYAAFVEEARKRNLQVEVQKCGCLGMCYAEPLVEVNVEGAPQVVYGKVTKEIAVKILEKHVVSKMLVNDYIFTMET